MYQPSGAPRLPRAARKSNGLGMLLLLAAATGVLLAVSDVLQEQRKRVGNG